MWSKTRVFALGWIFVFFLFQNTLNLIFPPNFKFLLVGVVFYSLIEGAFFGAVLGAAAGLFVDFFGPSVPGPHSLILGLAGAVSGFTASKIFKDSFFNRWILPSLMGFFVDLGGGLSLTADGLRLLGFAVFTVLISPPLFFFLERVSGVKKSRHRSW